jgi:hypothetical protein
VPLSAPPVPSSAPSVPSSASCQITGDCAGRPSGPSPPPPAAPAPAPRGEPSAKSPDAAVSQLPADCGGRWSPSASWRDRGCPHRAGAVSCGPASELEGPAREYLQARGAADVREGPAACRTRGDSDPTHSRTRAQGARVRRGCRPNRAAATGVVKSMGPPRSVPTLRPPEGGTAGGSASAARRARSAYGASRAVPGRAAGELHGARDAEHPGGPAPGATHARGGAPRPRGDDSARGADRSRSAANASRAACASAANAPAAICR